jgi:hypothetical protein
MGRDPPSNRWAAAAIHYTAGNTVGIVWRAWALLGRTFEQLLSPDRWMSTMHRGAFKHLKMQGEQAAIGAEDSTVAQSAPFPPRPAAGQGRNPVNLVN